MAATERERSGQRDASFRLPSPVEELTDPRLADRSVRLLLKRDDLINPEVPGNKWRKLKYNLEAARRDGYETLLTFGGAYSNHIRATSAAGHRFGFRTIGVIRGEPHEPLNPVLAYAVQQGMTLTYLDRTAYRCKHEPNVVQRLHDEFGEFYLLPEGGSNALALRGCAEIPGEITEDFTAIYDQTATAAEIDAVLDALPHRYRPLVGLAVGTGLRWGECVGLRWDAIDLEKRLIRVIRVAVEVAGHVSAKPYPKSKAGRRDVPIPPFIAAMLDGYAEAYPPGPLGEVFTNTAGGPMRRTLFRSRIWRPALVRSGLLGQVAKLDRDLFLASWRDAIGLEQTEEFATERDAVKHVARYAVGGLRFHDLRHTYATWLVSEGVPINDVASVLGHEQTSTTLNRYTHASRDRHARVRSALADFSLTTGHDLAAENDEDPSDEGS